MLFYTSESECEKKVRVDLFIIYTGKLCHPGQQWHVSLDTTVAQEEEEQAFVYRGSLKGFRHQLQ